MMEFLAVSHATFSQVVAIDAEFLLFSRAWCMSELATASRLGIQQRLRVLSAETLALQEQQLRQLQIQRMRASRVEDVVEILAMIPDHEAFNTRLQTLIFEDLLPHWRSQDALEQVARAGRILRWQLVVKR